jgi:hypothetical protein
MLVAGAGESARLVDDGHDLARVEATACALGQDLGSAEQRRGHRIVVGRDRQLANLLPLTQRFGRIGSGRDHRASAVPVRRGLEIAGSLVVVGDERGATLRTRKLLERGGDGRVTAAPLLSELGVVRDFLRDAMAERVAPFVDRANEIGRDELDEQPHRFSAVDPRNRRQRRPVELDTDHRRRVEEVALVALDPIDTRCDHGLNARRDRELGEVGLEPSFPDRSDQLPRFDQRSQRLLDEEGVASRPLVEEPGDLERLVGVDQPLLHQLLDLLEAQRFEVDELRVVG